MGRFLDRMKARRQRRADMRDRLMNERETLREDIKLKRIKKRFNKKRGKIDTGEEVQMEEYTPKMNSQLQEQGIEVENPQDDVEVSTKYNAQVLGGEEVPQEDYDRAYVLGDDCYDSYEEHVEERTKAKDRIRSFFGVVGGAIKGAMEVAKEKKRRGEPLTKTDKSLLDLDSETRYYGKKQAKFELQKLALPALIVLVLYMVFKN